ncbi:hypothetical protein EVAR_47695_1 [Eumeta japonica]|uniref:Uncharacterized protein n=1 Tax=Eumeta variegata TaxID=151549 RepID=A0A4C1XR86_EUMVA|nr:hypothetical protein EVAR_47695_1 [Eumeta japonica]
MLVARLNWHLMPTLYGTQYAFMPQRGTEDSLFDLMTPTDLQRGLQELHTKLYSRTKLLEPSPGLPSPKTQRTLCICASVFQRPSPHILRTAWRAKNAKRCTTQRGSQSVLYLSDSLNSALILSSLLPIDIRLEKPVRFCELPHPERAPDIHFESIESLDFETIDRLAIEGPHIFTDGSRIQEKVGLALLIDETEWRPGT